MATGASNADLAIVLIDARKGVLTQTRRHSFILSLIGVKHVVLAVNKIDLVGYDQTSSTRSRPSIARSPRTSGFETLVAIPVSALRGDNILTPSRAACPGTRDRSWCPISRPSKSRGPHAKPMRFPVQWVNRPNLDFRGFSGTVASGVVRAGDEVLIAASRKPAKVARIVTMDGDLDRGHRRAGGDAGPRPRGRYFARRHADPSGRDAGIFQPVPGAHGLDERESRRCPGRSYLLKIGAQLVPATITDLKFRTNVNTLEQTRGQDLELNEVGTLTIATDKPIAFDAYATTA